MPVALIFTGFTRHPKIRRAGVPAAAWLFVCCLEYAAEYGTDGFIPTGAIEGFGVPGTKANLKRLLYSDERLGPLLHTVDGGYEINDYLEWNRRAKQLQEATQAKSEARSKAGKKGAEVRWGGRLTGSNSDGKPHGKAVANGSQTDDSGSGSGSSVVLSPLPDLRDARAIEDQPRGDEPPDPIIRARRRAQAPWPDPAWSLQACKRVVQRAAYENSPIHGPNADDTQNAWDRLAILAALDTTRSPGRLLEPTGWDLAGRQLAEQRRADANQQAQLEEREARNRGQVACEHGYLLLRQCPECRVEARTA